MSLHRDDTRWMALALSLGRRGLGQTWPNPAVGCVLVRDGIVVGRGWTQPGGRPHAEVVALTQAGNKSTGATAYVTLEPCAHHGQTAPCAEALIAAGVTRVVSALEDPDSRVAGKGHDILRAAGIDVATGCLAEQAAADHAGFLKHRQAGRPFLTLKLAGSFDGRIATKNGESQWITGPEARRLGHHFRATHDAVLIGSATAIADDPTLNVRGMGDRSQPMRIVFDTHLRTPTTGNLGQAASDNPVVLCHGPNAESATIEAWRTAGARLIQCDVDVAGRIDTDDALCQLAKMGLTRIYCEGGGTLAASLLAGGHVDQLVGFTAGLALGGDGLPMLGPLPDLPLAEMPRFTLQESRAIGGDVLHIWRSA